MFSIISLLIISLPATGRNTCIKTVLSGWVVHLYLASTPTVSLGSQSHRRKCPRAKRICISHTSSSTATESWPFSHRNLSTAKYKYMSASKIRGCCSMHAVREWITQPRSGQAGSIKLEAFVNEHEKDKQALFSKSLTNNGHSVILMTQTLDFLITHLKYFIAEI